MKLTQKKALMISIELWEWLKESGLQKEDWPGWEKYGEMDDDIETLRIVAQINAPPTRYPSSASSSS